MFLRLDEALKVLNLNKDFSEDELEKAYKKAQNDETLDKGLLEASYNFLKSSFTNPEEFNNFIKMTEESKIRENNAEKEHNSTLNKAKEEKQKRLQIKNEKLTNIYNEINNYNFMYRHNITLEDFLNNPRFQSHMVNIYNLAKDIFNNKDKYLKQYFDYSALVTPDFGDLLHGTLKKTLEENKKKKKNRIIYENRMETEFGTADEAIESVYNLYEDYIDYGFVLDKLDIKDLKKFILGDQERRTGIKAAAEQRLKFFLYECEKKVLNEETSKLFLNIHNNVYRKDIIMINSIEKYVENNYDFSYNDIKCKPNRDTVTRSIYESFIKLDNNTNKLYSKYKLIYLITDVCHMMDETYKTIPNKIFVFNGNWDNVAINLKNVDSLKDFYKLSFEEGITLCYEVYLNVKDSDKYKDLSFLDSLTLIHSRFKAFKLFNLFGRSSSMEKIALMDDTEYDKLLHKSERSKKLFKELVNDDSRYIEYHKIYTKFKERFENEDFKESIEYIKDRCEKLTDFSNDEEIEKLLDKKPFKSRKQKEVVVEKTINEVSNQKKSDKFNEKLYNFVDSIKNISRDDFDLLNDKDKIDLLNDSIKVKYDCEFFDRINRIRQKDNKTTLKRKEFDQLNLKSKKKLVLELLEAE